MEKMFGELRTLSDNYTKSLVAPAAILRCKNALSCSPYVNLFYSYANLAIFA